MQKIIRKIHQKITQKEFTKKFKTASKRAGLLRINPSKDDRNSFRHPLVSTIV